MITGKELRDVLIRSPFAVLFFGVFVAAIVSLVLYFIGTVSAAAIVWVPFGTVGVIVLGALVARRRRHVGNEIRQ